MILSKMQHILKSFTLGKNTLSFIQYNGNEYTNYANIANTNNAACTLP